MTKLYLKCTKNINFTDNFMIFGSFPDYFLIGDYYKLKKFIKDNHDFIKYHFFDTDYANLLMEYENYESYNARVEKGAIIRKNVILDNTSIILMGAVINIGAQIGKNTMIDMNAVIGSGAIIKDNIHISAGVVIAGVLEPKSNKPVIIENNVFIGANSVIKEGIHIGEGAIIGANSFINKDIEPYTLNYGSPSKLIRKTTKKDYENVALNFELRKIK